MTKQSPKIVFFGSGPVAARSLELLAKNFAVGAVVTKPQPPHHKEIFPVLKVAEELNLSVITTVDPNELDAKFKEASLESQLGVVIDYGILIPQAVIDYFPLGIVNSHFSLLPQWRGADPISFSILSGQATTGVSLMLIVAALDEGPLLAQAEYKIDPAATTPSLTEELIELSDLMLKETLPLYIEDTIQPAPQAEASIIHDKTPSYSRKLEKQDGLLDWHKPARQLEHEIRAYKEWPRSRTQFGNVKVIVTDAHTENGSGTPGNLLTDNRRLAVQCQSGILIIDKLIPAGKKEMSAEAFLAGYKLSR